MKVLRYIVTDAGLVLIVEAVSDRDRAEAQAQFNDWAQMASGHNYPVLILPGDEDTKVDDLRTVPA